MKSRRRHELQTNELAASIVRLMERAKEHKAAIIAGVVVAAVLVAVPIVYTSLKGKKETGAASAFASALYSNDPDSMRTFLQSYPEAKQVPLARLAMADRLLGDVVRGLRGAPGEDVKAKASRYLAEAKDLYNEVASKDADLAPLARVGLALVAIQEGDMAKGKADLKEVISQWPDSLAAAKANLHLEALAGYKPVPFSNDKEEKEPAAKSGEGKEGEPKAGQAKPPEVTAPEPKTPKPPEPEPKKETKPEAKPATTPGPKPKG